MLWAVDFVSVVVSRPECARWHFGLDTGNCVFAWTNLSGYFALGAPVQRARILSRLAERHKTKVVISAPVREALPDLPIKKLDILNGKEGRGEEELFRLSLGG